MNVTKLPFDETAMKAAREQQAEVWAYKGARPNLDNTRQPEAQGRSLLMAHLTKVVG